MTWTNAFDAGPCTVTVSSGLAGGAYSSIYSGDLGKGQSDTFAFNDQTYTIAVDASGRVTLSFDGTYIGGSQYAVDVAPADMTGVVGGRLVDVAQYLDTNGFPQGQQYARGDAVDDIYLSGGSGGGGGG